MPVPARILCAASSFVLDNAIEYEHLANSQTPQAAVLVHTVQHHQAYTVLSTASL
jgi:hypothetical protein